MTPKGRKTPKISIVIRSYNEEKHLANLLNSIQEQEYQDYEIILVDSGSSDNTLNLAKQFKVNIIHITKNEFTFGRSLNLGIQNAQGKIIVIASAHIIPKTNKWLSSLIADFDDPKIALTYGKQRGGKGSKFSEDQHWRHWFPDHSNRDQKQNFCNNANSAIRRSMWELMPFNEKLTGLEDIAWGSWAKEQGNKIAYIAEAGVEHLHDESPEQVLNRHHREAIALKQILPESTFSIWNFASLTVQKSMSDIKRAIIEGVFWNEVLGIITYRFLQYWGTYKGYNEKGTLTREIVQSFYFPPSDLEPQSKNTDSGNGETLRKSS